MKIQYLAVIFIIIIMPIIIVFSEYINNQITIVNTEGTYDARLLNSTYDAVKAYQLNTINSTYYTPDARVKDIDAAVNTFFYSLVTSFGYRGNKSSIMNEYVPAVVFSMYDGYYIYSPFTNVITEQKDENVDDEYKDNSIKSGLKPYVYYNCRYKINDNNDIIITYTLDNYITVEGKLGGAYVHESGCLAEGIGKSGTSYTYDGVTFNSSTTERLKEFLGDKEYYYAVVDGTKYYYSKPVDDSNINVKEANDYIFYFNEKGYKSKQVTSYLNNEELFDQYYNKIMGNNSAYEYYKNAYEFTDWVKNNLSAFKTDNIVDSANYSGYEFTKINNPIFKIDDTDGIYIQDSNSDFNIHRADVIRAVIETNLSTAISGFKKYTKSTDDFIMPKISEKDWELLQNNVCCTAFLQGMTIAGKRYNSYAVVPNNLTKEYVDENDIYILKTDKTYAKANDNTLLNDANVEDFSANGYYPGILKINFERRKNENGYFNPISYWDSTKYSPYLGSYTSIVGTSELNPIEYTDMYRYMRGITNVKLKTVYYTALGRERNNLFRADR